MGQKFELDGKEYDVENLSDTSKKMLAHMDFTNKKIKELENMQALLQRAKISYVNSLKKEMLSDKAGFLFGED